MIMAPDVAAAASRYAPNRAVNTMLDVRSDSPRNSVEARQAKQQTKISIIDVIAE